MTSLLSDTERYDQQVTVYDTTDPWSPQVINGPVTQLANRTAWLRAQLELAAPWTPLDVGVDFSSTAPSTISITMLADLTELIIPGIPVRVFDLTGIDYNDTSSQISGFHEIIGLDSVLCDSRGRLHFSIVDDGGGFYHVDAFNLSSRSAASKIAHTATYNSTGAKPLLADNASGVGGQITIDAVTAPDVDIYVEFFKWFIVHSISSSVMGLRGRAMSTAAGRITELWIGQAERVVKLHLYAPGQYALGASNTVLRDLAKQGYRWLHPYARFCRHDVYADAISGGPPSINLRVAGLDQTTSGVTPLSAKTWYSTTIVNPVALAAAPNDTIELTTTAGAAGDQDLTVEARFVLE